LEIFRHLNATFIPFYAPNAVHALFIVETSPTEPKMQSKSHCCRLAKLQSWWVRKGSSRPERMLLAEDTTREKSRIFRTFPIRRYLVNLKDLYCENARIYRGSLRLLGIRGMGCGLCRGSPDVTVIERTRRMKRNC
jgi:hypothetical protein